MELYLVAGIVLVTILIVLLLIRSSKSGDSVILLGLCDSGKTSLFGQLTTGKELKTQTSIIENKGKISTTATKNGKPWKLIDIPGHERVRDKYFYNNKDNARGILFLIDSVNFPREIRDVAECMYDLLANRTMQRNKVSVMVACNKQDIPTAKSHNVIKSQLEKELNKLRQTRSAALLGIDDYSSSRNAFIGKQGKDFEFSHVNPIKVEFCECNLKNTQVEGEVKVDGVRTWLEKL
ncbi:signal recognition particle receptor subunit beta-like [Clytia hemisphaerica]|uniref:Signal recognition particle receptor subunit beta n=1 Tax=Clytia hemisphaerica TaxID=252671 RepID=A0A7M6DNC5_9CNID|eukprot:TCONS_00072727-protein